MFARMRQAGQTPLVKVSRTVARQVLEQGIAILGTDVPGSGDLGQVESLAASQVHSLLCVPLTVFQRVIGCIYVDSNSPGNRLLEEHLQLVTAIAGISAMALENAGRLQWLELENERLTEEVSQERSLVGEGPQMREIYQFLKRVAPTDSTVLIEGRAGPARSWRRAPCIATVRGRTGRLWRSIARRFRRRFWRAICSATSGVRSRARRE